MIVAKNDEVKRSRLWRIALLVSSVLIVLVVIFLLTKLFTTNPLEGSWEDENGKISLSVEPDGTASVTVSEAETGQVIQVPMKYTIDRDAKTVTIEKDLQAIREAVEESDGNLTQESMEAAAESLDDSFDYSVDQEQLTLTEREYGEQMTFIKE